jgi:FMN reductase
MTNEQRSDAPAPYIVALGGTLRPDSSTEKALRAVTAAAAATGARTLVIAGPDLELPMYAPERMQRSPAALRLVDELRKADGIVIGSPGYHGGISGLVKNALDYAEDLRGDADPYFHGRAVGCIATAAGWQGAVNTLAALRNVVHALRGWNTPLGVAINTAEPVFDADGTVLAPRIKDMLELLGREVADFARRSPRQRSTAQA